MAFRGRRGSNSATSFQYICTELLYSFRFTMAKEKCHWQPLDNAFLKIFVDILLLPAKWTIAPV